MKFTRKEVHHFSNCKSFNLKSVNIKNLLLIATVNCNAFLNCSFLNCKPFLNCSYAAQVQQKKQNKVKVLQDDLHQKQL